MKGLGIKYQLRLATLIPVLVVAILFAVFYNGQLNKDLNQHLSRVGEAYIHQLLPTAQFAMMHHDYQSLQNLINSSTLNPEVKALAFYNAKGQLLAYRGGKHAISKPFISPRFTGDYIESIVLNSYTINFTAPIPIPTFNLYSSHPLDSTTSLTTLRADDIADDILGWLSLNIDTQSILIKRYQMLIVTIFITLLGLVISLTIHYFLSRRIYLPIAKLRRSMKQILSNEFETHIPISSPGELGIIEKGCSYLQQQYLNTVKDLNHHIEVATEDLQQGLELLEEKNIELSLDKKRCEERSRQKSEFIANMSHEIRNPMNGVIGFTNVLLESKLDNLQMDYVKTIKSSAQDLLTIINDILDYSKMDAGKLHLDCIPVDVRSCIDEVLILAAPLAHKKGLDLIPSTDLNVPHKVLGDPIRIKQILTNLINNAIKFTDNGHVLIHTTVEKETKKHYNLCLSVIDTGMGISLEDQPKLFSAFNQADTSITRRFGGSGLGLVICKKLAEQMQGCITFSSEVNKGSVFNVKIKLEKLLAYEVEKEQSHRFHQLNVLCFDDNPLYLEAMCNGLGFLGITCLQINNVEQLQQTLKEYHDCDLAFISINEGGEKQIVEMLRATSIPCILISKCTVHNPEAFGAEAFLFKPISIQKLHDTIATVLNEGSHQLPSDHTLEHLRTKIRLFHPHILIAEDNPVNRMLLSSFLQQCQVDLVDDGEEAIKACQNQRYQAILLDLRMPKINGMEAAQLIRKHSSLNKQTAILVISADISHLSQEIIRNSGVDFFLQKPIDEKQLLNCLLKILNKPASTAIDWQLCIQKVSGNHALAEEFLKYFVEELRKNREEFMDLLQKKNIEGLERTAHKLHGACCFCGVPHLQTQVIRLEKQAKTAKHIDEIKNTFIELIRCIDEVLDEFDNLFQINSL